MRWTKKTEKNGENWDEQRKLRRTEKTEMNKENWGILNSLETEAQRRIKDKIYPVFPKSSLFPILNTYCREISTLTIANGVLHMWLTTKTTKLVYRQIRKISNKIIR